MNSTTTFSQLELGVPAPRAGLVNVRQQRFSRASWWFGKMRQVVDLARPQTPAGHPRPEQTYLNLGQRALL